MKIETTEHANSLRVELSSGNGEEYAGCKLVIAGGHTHITIPLPAIVKPHETKVIATSWDEDTIKRMGGNYYFKYDTKYYGFYYCSEEGYLRINYGRDNSDNGMLTKGKGFCIPWKQTRFARNTVYWPNTTDIFYEAKIKNNRYVNLSEHCEIELTQVPKKHFKLLDYDGEEIVATCFVEEREWRKGTGWFKWLSWFNDPIINRTINIEFNKGTTKRKEHSWKGGITGTSYPIGVFETVKSAIEKYCIKHDMTYVEETFLMTIIQRKTDAFVEDFIRPNRKCGVI